MSRVEILRPALSSARVFLSFAFVISLSVGLHAQSPLDAARQAPASGDSASAEAAFQTRIHRARALIAAHQLETAASELETVRAATHDSAIRNITSVMLMGIYLESGNYGRAEALLEESFRVRSEHGGSVRTYFALAGQAINGARTHLGRYRNVGIYTSDSNLPVEAVSDLDRLRSFLERMIAQAKEISNERKAYDSLSLLEDVLGIRLSLARDGEDQAKWSTEYVTARELLASSPTQIAALSGISALPPAKVKSNKTPSTSPYSTRRASDVAEKKAPEKSENAAHPRSSNDSRTSQPTPQDAAQSQSATAAATGSKSTEQPLQDFGLLNTKASRRVLPRYPSLAKRAGAAGLVRVHVVVDENGKVIEVSKSEGPPLLRQVAEDAARQWYFEGITGPDNPVRFKGYIDFNFTL